MVLILFMEVQGVMKKLAVKERVLSVRDENHKWNPKYQRVEPWHIFNTNLDIGQSFRIFPLSNWTELDIGVYTN